MIEFIHKHYSKIMLAMLHLPIAGVIYEFLLGNYSLVILYLLFILADIHNLTKSKE